jgi:hypothetical protein
VDNVKERMSPAARAVRLPALDTVCVPAGCGVSDRHEFASLRVAAERVAQLLGMSCKVIRTDHGGGDGRYWIPAQTLLAGEAEALGIAGEGDLWGGVVPEEFVATKLVSHPRLSSACAIPEGWRELEGIEGCTLPGYAVFDRVDAAAAGRDLLEDGPLRVKCPFARGGHGQEVMATWGHFLSWLEATPDAVFRRGLTLERDLVRAVTYSVGTSHLPGMRIAYVGTQRNTRDQAGATVYGGSTLLVCQGGLDAMLAFVPAGDIADVIAAAVRYDQIVRGIYGVIASRCNYDVIAGMDGSGRRHIGVLEQSWRFGGASMAEVLAMERFRERPGLRWVVAETVESYGGAPPPADAVITWTGGDASPCKYARVVCDGY